MGHLELKIFPYKLSKEKTTLNQLPISKILEISILDEIEDVEYDLLNEPSCFPQLVSSVHGLIKILVFHYSWKERRKDKDGAGLENVIESLSAVMTDVEEIMVITDVNASNEFKSRINSIKKATVYPCVINGHKGFTRWASDPYKAVHHKKDGKLYLIEPWSMIYRGSSDDQHVVDDLVSSTTLGPKLNTIRRPIRFDGGNILVGNDFVLIGGDVQKHNNDKIKEVFEKSLDFEKKIYILKATPPSYDESMDIGDRFVNIVTTESARGETQSIFHLDLFITLAGLDGDNRNQLVIGNPVIGLSEKKLANLPYKALGVIFEQIYRIRYSINQIVKELEEIKDEKTGKKKFVITRIPMPLTYYDKLSIDNLLVRTWYFATYNNCLVEVGENDPTIKRVYIPSYADDYTQKIFPEEKKSLWNSKLGREEDINYGNWKDDLKTFEDEVATIWKDKLGFEAIFINAHFNQYAQLNGSLACLVNCIERED